VTVDGDGIVSLCHLLYCDIVNKHHTQHHERDRPRTAHGYAHTKSVGAGVDKKYLSRWRTYMSKVWYV
jgi:hypothetical protein